MGNKARKIKPETIEKIGLTAIGVGSALLYVSNDKFRSAVKKGVQQRLNAAAKNPPANAQTNPQTKPSDFTSGCPATGVVYLLKAGPFYKIGKATDFAKRLSQIKLQLPYPVEVIHRIASDDISATERYWHRKFAHQRAHGEWFTLNDAELAEFKSVAKM